MALVTVLQGVLGSTPPILASLPNLQGYGLTESCGTVCILPPEFFSFGPVGIPCAEIKLLDVPEAGYKAQGKIPQGEILIRGPCVTKGYFKRPDLNEDPTVFTKDGWFRTGDVGQWNEDGTMSIIDRVKNLVKLSGGEVCRTNSIDTLLTTSRATSSTLPWNVLRRHTRPRLSSLTHASMPAQKPSSPSASSSLTKSTSVMQSRPPVPLVCLHLRAIYTCYATHRQSKPLC
jgi:AMP-binding enzyme